MMSLRTLFIAPAAALATLAGVVVAVPGGAPAALAATCPRPGGVAVPSAPAGGSGIVVQGNGWGHSLGMSQYGAQGAARLGCSHAQILSTYYQGTKLVSRSMTAPVQLSLLSGSSRSTVLAENAAVTWNGSTGTATQPKGQTWTVVRRQHGSTAGSAVLDLAGTEQAWAPSTGQLVLRHGGVTVRLRSYRSGSSPSLDMRLRWGATGFQETSSGTTVTEKISSDRYGTAVQKYLWGLAEVPVSWPKEALRAQADAARTYLAGMYSRSAAAYLIGTTTAAQVYSGATREDQDAGYVARHPGTGWKAAVNGTGSEVIVDARGGVISAMYSSSDGGHSESRAYVYGSQGGYGYLSGIDDSRWDLASDNPYRSWSATFEPSDFARRLGFTSVSAVSIGAPGSAARDGGLKVTGIRAGGTVTAYVTGSSLRGRLGLRSAGIRVTWPAPGAAVGARGTLPPGYGWFATGRTRYTAASVARRYGLGVAGLAALNPGLRITRGSQVLPLNTPVKVRSNAGPWSLAAYLRLHGGR